MRNVQKIGLVLVAASALGLGTYSLRERPVVPTNSYPLTHQNEPLPAPLTLEDKVAPSPLTRESHGDTPVYELPTMAIGENRYDLTDPHDINELVAIVKARSRYSHHPLTLSEAELDAFFNADTTPSSLVERLGIFLEEDSYRPLEASRLVRLLHHDPVIETAIQNSKDLLDAYNDLIIWNERFKPTEMTFEKENSINDFGQAIQTSRETLEPYTLLDAALALKQGHRYDENTGTNREIFRALNKEDYGAYHRLVGHVIETINNLSDEHALFASERLSDIGAAVIVADSVTKQKSILPFLSLGTYAERAVEERLRAADEIISSKREGVLVSELYQGEVSRALSTYCELSDLNSPPHYLRITEATKALKDLNP